MAIVLWQPQIRAFCMPCLTFAAEMDPIIRTTTVFDMLQDRPTSSLFVHSWLNLDIGFCPINRAADRSDGTGRLPWRLNQQRPQRPWDRSTESAETSRMTLDEANLYDTLHSSRALVGTWQQFKKIVWPFSDRAWLWTYWIGKSRPERDTPRMRKVGSTIITPHSNRTSVCVVVHSIKGGKRFKG